MHSFQKYFLALSITYFVDLLLPGFLISGIYVHFRFFVFFCFCLMKFKIIFTPFQYKGRFYFIKLAYLRPLLLNYMFQTRRMSGHMLVVSTLPLFLQCLDFTLEQFRLWYIFLIPLVMLLSLYCTPQDKKKTE